MMFLSANLPVETEWIKWIAYIIAVVATLGGAFFALWYRAKSAGMDTRITLVEETHMDGPSCDARHEKVNDKLGEIYTCVKKLDSKFEVAMTRIDGKFDAVNTRMDNLEGRMNTLDGSMDALKGAVDVSMARLETKMTSRIDNVSMRVDGIYKILPGKLKEVR